MAVADAGNSTSAWGLVLLVAGAVGLLATGAGLVVATGGVAGP
ncbi:hypothetical protein OAL64_00220 [bacterium]|nr:hypothetical protein [bacterium]